MRQYKQREVTENPKTKTFYLNVPKTNTADTTRTELNTKFLSDEIKPAKTSVSPRQLILKNIHAMA